MSNFWLEQFENHEADGIDFHDLFDVVPFNKIIASYTKEEMLTGKAIYPKSGYTFWKEINGKKYYLIPK